MLTFRAPADKCRTAPEDAASKNQRCGRAAEGGGWDWTVAAEPGQELSFHRDEFSWCSGGC